MAKDIIQQFRTEEGFKSAHKLALIQACLLEKNVAPDIILLDLPNIL